MFKRPPRGEVVGKEECCSLSDEVTTFITRYHTFRLVGVISLCRPFSRGGKANSIALLSVFYHFPAFAQAYLDSLLY